MRTYRRLLYLVILFLTQISFSKNNMEPLDRSFAQKLCDPVFVGAVEESLLRLARGNPVDLTSRWKKSAVFRPKINSQEVSVIYKKGALPEILSDKDFLANALNEELRFLKKIAQKKLSKKLALYFTENATFEFQFAANEGSKVVELFKWNFEVEGVTYSFGLVAPPPDNADLENLHRPLIPHCSEEKIKEFKETYKPLQYLWSSSGVPTGEQGAELFKNLRKLIPESSR